jgi:tRNA (guanine-N7-)-methyltransferase
MGQALLDWAEAEPGLNLLGIDVYQPGIGALLSARASRGIEHLLVVEEDANVALETMFQPGCLTEIRVFFPDPWPKKRHHKRRLVQKPFAALLADKLVDGGRLRLATDWEDYARWMREVLDGEPRLVNEADGFADRFEGREITRFEARGQRLGHGVWDLSYTRAVRKTDDAEGPEDSPA